MSNVYNARSYSKLRQLSLVSAVFLLLSAGNLHAQDAEPEPAPPSAPPAAGQNPYDPSNYGQPTGQTIYSQPSMLGPGPIAGSAQSLSPIYYYPGLLDKSTGSSILLSETLGYKDNVFGLPSGALPPVNSTRGDWYRTTTVGGTGSLYAGAQRFYVNGTYSLTDYSHDKVENNANYVLNAGWNWVLTSRCLGTLIATDSLVQSPQNLIGSITTNNIKTIALNETAKCGTTDHMNVIFDSGTSKNTNTLQTSIINDANVNFIRGGLEYNLTELNTLGAKVTPTTYDYFNRSLISAPGLATSLKLTEYAVYYRRLFSPKLEFNGTYGITDVSGTTPGFGISNASAKIWNASLKWNATPKVSITGTASQTVSPPSDIAADVQLSRVNSLAVSYYFSPRLTFNGVISEQRSTFASSGLLPGVVQASQKAVFATLGAIYQITPMLNATANYSYTHQMNGTTGVQSGLQTTANVYLFGLNYQH